MKNQNHTSHIALHTSQNGITLIALIITIIVMLILVGVTINVALNGGLFEKAETATKQTQIEAEKEELLSAVVAAIGTDAKVDFDHLDDNLPNNWDGEDGTYTSLKGNTYTVDENGKITEENDDSDGFYGYEYYLDMGEGNVTYFYILDNGLIIQKEIYEGTIKGYIYSAYEYSLEGNVISFVEQQGVISDDYKTIDLGKGIVLTKNDNKKFEFEGTLNEEYNIYVNAVYHSYDAKYSINTFDISDDEYGYKICVNMINYGFTPSIEEFLATEGVEVSQNGKQIVYDGITYYLVEE